MYTHSSTILSDRSTDISGQQHIGKDRDIRRTDYHIAQRRMDTLNFNHLDLIKYHQQMICIYVNEPPYNDPTPSFEGS